MAAENAASQEVLVGERSYRIARFRGLKAQLILKLTAELAKAYPDLQSKVAEFEQSYIDESSLTLSRTEVELRYGADAERISEAAWETTGGEYKLKQMPTTQERLAAIWPDLLLSAEVPVLRLLAVISLSNEDLRAADEADTVDEKIEERRKELLYDGPPEELVELAVAGVNVARDQFGPLARKAAPLLAKVGLGMMGIPEPMESSISPEEESPSPPPSSASETRAT